MRSGATGSYFPPSFFDVADFLFSTDLGIALAARLIFAFFGFCVNGMNLSLLKKPQRRPYGTHITCLRTPSAEALGYNTSPLRGLLFTSHIRRSSYDYAHAILRMRLGSCNNSNLRPFGHSGMRLQSLAGCRHP